MRKNKRDIQNDFSILTLDDDTLMTSTIQAYFQRNGYRVDVENDPYQGIEKVRNGSYDILLLDFLMSPICGDQVVEAIRKFNSEIFIILLTGHKSMAPPIQSVRTLDIQGYYEKSDRFDQLELLVESCVKSIRQMRDIRAYQKELSLAYNKMEKAYWETIQTLRLLVETRDEETRGHSDRVAALAARLAERLQLPASDVEQIKVAGIVHDIGKIGVPDKILLKPGPLTSEEFESIKKHPEVGADILEGITSVQELAPVVRSHHERFDGSGYPAGLAGEEIPLCARIIAVADSFDAMISNRAYRKGLPMETAVDEIKKGSGSQFDPMVAEAFLSLLKDHGTEAFLKDFGTGRSNTDEESHE